MNPQLSPAAKAILEAYDNSPWEYDTGDFTACAAVLRAAVDEVISSVPTPCGDYDGYAQGFLAARIKYRNQILVIADELEAQ